MSAQRAALCLATAGLLVTGAGALESPSSSSPTSSFSAGSEPTDLHGLECKIHSFAYEFGIAKALMPSAPKALHDALNLDNCSSDLTQRNGQNNVVDVEADIARALKARVDTEARRLVSIQTLAKTVFYVSATGGSDTNDGSQQNPFASLARAKTAAAAAAKPAAVFINEGKYFVNETLTLGAADSSVIWAAYPGGAKVVVSGGQLLADLDWKPTPDNPDVFVASVVNVSSFLLSEEERSFWSMKQTKQIHHAAAVEDRLPLNTETSDPLPPAPEGWKLFPGHCIGDHPCGLRHCDCAVKAQLDDESIQGPSNLTVAFAKAKAACAANAACKSFAIMSDRYELFSNGNNSAVPNSDWQAYALEEPPPSPPPAHTWGAPPAVWNTLHVNGVRQVRARFPNGNPQDNSGLCFSKVQREGEGCDAYLSARGNPYTRGPQNLPGSKTVASLKNEQLDRTKAPSSPVAGGDGGPYGTFHYDIFDPPEGHPVYNKPMPDWTWPNNSLLSFWSDPMSRPAGVVYGTDINKTYSNAATGVVHMFHSGLWGGWQYQLSSQHQGSQSLLFSHGGYQEARGSSIQSQHYFVENIREELDAPCEWFHDPVAHQLYFYPNTTTTTSDTGGKVTSPADSEIVAPFLTAIFRVEGATDVQFVGLTFTETRATYLDQYEVPSGGDWSIHRGATVEIVDSANVVVQGCTFDQVGGNGVLLSRNTTHAQVLDSEFVYTGDSAIIAVGNSDGILGDAQTFPDETVVRGNLMHEIGVFGKQTSCFFQAKAARTLLQDNVCFNGPRAGINWNDGFVGGNNVTGNLVFNMVRETGDHGPYNSWDRQPYLTISGVADGYPSSLKPAGHSAASILKGQDSVERNFIINGYNGVWTIDHDDGSQYVNDTGNFMVFGGCKNYLGNHKSCDGNVIVHPGIASRASGGRRCQTDDNKVFMNQYHGDNHCFTQDGVFYSMHVEKCDSSMDPHVYQTFNNTMYSPNATFSNGPCTTFTEWQAAGQDAGSQVLSMPSDDDIVLMGRQLLGF